MLFLMLSTALAAPDPDAIWRRLNVNDYEGARKRCEKWSATNPNADPELRDVCAKADWPLAEARDTARVWEAYCEKWEGTQWAEVGFERFALATLHELRAPASEDDLLAIVDRFPETRAARDALEMAADAAIRDVDSAERALRAAQRYPDHPGLPPLVERYPEKFVSVIINEDLTIQAALELPIAIPPYMEPQPVWVARWSGGQSQAWEEVTREHLRAAGLNDSQFSIAGSGPPLPLCLINGQPEGFHAAVEVRVGAGRVYRPVPWDERCGAEVPPMVLTMANDTITGVSLNPAQSADLHSTALDGRTHTRHFLTTTPGTPLLIGAHVFSPVDRLWLVTPLQGGPPWLTDRAPSQQDAVVLPSTLVGTGLPQGLLLQSEEGRLHLHGEGIDDWTLPPGEAHFLSPLVRLILGVDAEPVAIPSGAPALRPQVPWIREDTVLQPVPPTGAHPLEMVALTEADIQQVQLRIESAGIAPTRLTTFDAWSVDIDRDNVVEAVVRGQVDGQGAVLVLDVHAELGNRLFVFGVVDAAASNEPNAPFAFTYGGHPYLAWIDASGEALELIRHDGQSMRSERLELTP